MKAVFIVTSAVNSRFGVYTPKERFDQTLDTIRSIKARCPNSKIIVMECAGVPLTEEQKMGFYLHCNLLIDYTQDENVVSIYNSTDNWDIVKNSTEILCFGTAIKQCQESKAFEGYDRVFKVSGRYLLNDQFDPAYYDTVPDKIVIGRKHRSQFPEHITTQPWQYMARLWSWPTSLTDRVSQVYQQSLVHFAQRVAAGGYTDIEHVLAKFLPPEHVVELEHTGIEGKIAPTGQSIKD